MTDLELVGTDDLVDELKRRFDGGVLFFIKDRTESEEQALSRYWGGSRAVACAVALKRKVIRQWERSARDPGIEH